MVYIIGDTHGDNSYIYNIQHKENLTKDDYIIVCGDFGFVWNGDYKRQLYKLHKCTEATILFVEGNHSNFDLLENFPSPQKDKNFPLLIYEQNSDGISWAANLKIEVQLFDTRSYQSIAL